MTRVCIAASLLLLATGCATAERTSPADGGAEHVIRCGYFGWYICYEKAKELCPQDYKVVSEREAGGGRELRISCVRK